MNYNSIVKNDFTSGDGVCVTLYVSGCPLRCPGCHNPQAQDPKYGLPFTDDTIKEVISALTANNIQRNLCVMGGEPFYGENAAEVLRLIFEVQEKAPDTKIYIWSGYTYEQLYSSGSYSTLCVLQNIDYLIDGPYIQEQRDITLKMRGSKNQRILRLENGKIVEEL